MERNFFDFIFGGDADEGGPCDDEDNEKGNDPEPVSVRFEDVFESVHFCVGGGPKKRTFSVIVVSPG